MYSSPPPYRPSLSTVPVLPAHAIRWNPAILHIANLLADTSNTYLVGGVVRDALRGLPISDIDLVTTADGLSVARQLANALNGAYYPVDKERGTGRALVMIEGASFAVDVATFRGPDLLADLQGRDFTVNAITSPLNALDRIVDPLDGQGDLLSRRVLRQCAESSIGSDPVRALRAVRTSLKFDLRMTPDTVEAARTAQNLLSGPDGLFQPERVRDETFKLLSQNEPVRALRLLVALDLLNGILPYPMPDAGIMAQLIRHVERFSQLETIISPRRNDNTASDVVLGLAVMVLDRWRAKLQEHLGREITGERPYLVLAILAALTPSSHEDAGPLWADHLRLSNEEAKIITRLIGAQKRISDRPPLDARSIHRYYREYGEAGVTGVLLWLARFIATSSTGLVDPVEWSNRLDNVAAPLLDAFFRHHQQIVSPPPFLTGEDLMQELSLPPGPVIGKLLTELLEAQAAGEITSRGDALAHARDMLGS